MCLDVPRGPKRHLTTTGVNFPSWACHAKIGLAGPILAEKLAKSGPARPILLPKSVRPEQFWQPKLVPLCQFWSPL